MPSGLTAVLISPASLFVAAVRAAHRPEREGPAGALGGMFLGLAGVALCVGVESVHSIWAFLGALAMVGAAACYALSSFVVKRYKGLTSMTTSFISILVAVVLTLPAAVATAPSPLPGCAPTLAMLALGVDRDRAGLRDLLQADRRGRRGPGLARLLPGAGRGAALRRVLLDEEITVAAIAGLALILGGVALASRRHGSDPHARASRSSATRCAGWLAENHPGPTPEGDDAGFEFRRAWQRKLNERGWAGLSWPEQYGGAGATLFEQAIFYEEIARASAPQMANMLGLAMGGPTVIAHGTDEQKERYLAPILSADEIWCQGFSEPQSGSDLASLKTRAVRNGDEWVVTGQKVWTTMAHQSKWCMLLARTDPDAAKHRGLTYFLMDMEQDGVEIRPLRQITGEAEFNELFIEEARIPHANIVGGENNGWSVAITTLMHERAGLAFALQVRCRSRCASCWTGRARPARPPTP